MEQEKFLIDMPEEVVLVPNPRIIRINNAQANRAYGLFDTKTGTQVKDFVKGNGGTIEFDDLNPAMHYDVGVIENPSGDKPQFAIMWNYTMRDDTDSFLSNSDNLPINYPCAYKVIFKDGNSKDNPVGNSVGNSVSNSSGIYDLVDDKGNTVGQVAQLSPQGVKPNFRMVRTFRMKDDTSV